MKSLFDIAQAIFTTEHFWRYENTPAFVQRITKEVVDIELDYSLAEIFTQFYALHKEAVETCDAADRPAMYELWKNELEIIHIN